MSAMKAHSNKYKAKGVWVELNSMTQFVNPTNEQKQSLTFFDSKLEFDCYIALRNFFKEQASIAIHKRIRVADFLNVLEGYKSVNYWKPDFLVSLLNSERKVYRQFVVEVKGQVLQPFPYQYALFRQRYPKVSILVVKTKTELVNLLKDAGFLKNRMGVEK